PGRLWRYGRDKPRAHGRSRPRQGQRPRQHEDGDGMTDGTDPAPEDRTLSPYTGWTRAHWTALADRMLAALEPYRSPGGARVVLPGPASRSGPDSDALEGYARSFLLAGFRITGERGEGAVATRLLETYAAGAAGVTDP